MIAMAAKRFLLNACVALCIIVAGCAGQKEYTKQSYVLEVDRPDRTVQKTASAVLGVRRFAVSEEFATKSLMYRTGRYEYDADFYNEYLIAPGEMVTAITREWLSDSDVFETVLSRNSFIDAAYTLDGNVLALYGDFAGDDPPEAVLAIKFFLISEREPDPVIVFKKTYRTSTVIERKSPEALVAGLSTSMNKILTELESDLGRAAR